MKKTILVLLITTIFSCRSTIHNKEKQSQSSLELINLATSQLDLMEKLKGQNGFKRDSIFLKKIYEPNLELWNNYLGNDKDFIEWLNTVAFPELSLYKKKGEELNLKKLHDYFLKTEQSFIHFTGFKPQGKWYIVFGPKWTDAGGFGNGTMVLDLANPLNDIKHIKQLFPHELNHQIYSNTIPDFESIVLKKIINEGFATYVSYLFHEGKTSLAEELHYTEQELKFCFKNEEQILQKLKKHRKSNDKNIATLFTARDYEIDKGFPGAIGYYLGFRIVEEYVYKNGKDSWKNIYTMTPENVLEHSGILN